jgi:hypothetical protein
LAVGQLKSTDKRLDLGHFLGQYGAVKVHHSFSVPFREREGALFSPDPGTVFLNRQR